MNETASTIRRTRDANRQQMTPKILARRSVTINKIKKSDNNASSSNSLGRQEAQQRNFCAIGLCNIITFRTPEVAAAAHAPIDDASLRLPLLLLPWSSTTPALTVQHHRAVSIVTGWHCFSKSARMKWGATGLEVQSMPKPKIVEGRYGDASGVHWKRWHFVTSSKSSHSKEIRQRQSRRRYGREPRKGGLFSLTATVCFGIVHFCLVGVNAIIAANSAPTYWYSQASPSKVRSKRLHIWKIGAAWSYKPTSENSMLR